MTPERCAAGVQKGEAVRSIMLHLLSDAYQSGLADKGGVRLPQEVVGPPVPLISIKSWKHAGTLASKHCAVYARRLLS